MLRQLISLAILALPLALTAQLNLKQIGQRSYKSDLATLAGCKTFVDKTGREYALVCSSRGLSIVDLSTPTKPVQRFLVPGPTSNWREVAIWKQFAYVGSEAGGSGITIVDLRSLPDTVYSKVWYGNGEAENLIQRSHTVGCAEGFLYVYGSNPAPNGAVICNISDPWNPKVAGAYRERYLHDGFVRGDTLWASEIFDGQFSVVDIKDKTNPKVLATQPTPAAFNHNTEVTPDGKFLYATDERANAPLSSFNVSNLDNIQLLDTYYPSQRPDGEVHNVRIKGNFLVNPSYKGQLTIVDATRPHNLIETGWAILGNSLVWDADPYLPSGIVVATAKEEGLFIFQPTYQRAAYLEGLTTDAVTGAVLAGVKIKVLLVTNEDLSKPDGRYATGAAEAGKYTITAEKTGYQPRQLTDIALQSGQVTRLDIALTPLSTGVFGEMAAQIQIAPTLFHETLRIDQQPGGPFRRLQLVQLSSGKIVREFALSDVGTTLQGLADLPKGAYAAVFLTTTGAAVTRRVVKI